MLVATFVATLFIPLFFVLLAGRRARRGTAGAPMVPAVDEAAT